MGFVLKARDTKTGSLVAVKQLRPELRQHAGLVQLFHREARKLLSVRDKQEPGVEHIVPVLAVSHSAEHTWFAMPWYSQNLADLIRAHGKLETKAAVSIARSIARALLFLHSSGRLGFVHRDLKPANILIDESGSAFLADFGLAHSVFGESSGDLLARGFEGTAPYVSPQVARGKAEDTRSDIYSFGAVLYEMLTGRPPYAGTTREAILEQICATPPKPILQLNPSASLSLVRIAEGAMERELENRYAHIQYVVDDLERVARGEKPKGPKGSRSLVKALLATMSDPWIRAAIAFAALLAFALGIRLLSAPRLSLVRRFDSPHVFNWNQAKVAHWSGSVPWILVPHADGLLFVTSDGHTTLHWPQPPGSEMLDLDFVEDVDGDGRNEAMVSWRKGSEMYCSLINQNRFAFRNYREHGRPLTGDPTERPLSQMSGRLVVDLHGNGQKVVITSVATGGKLKPKGIRCFDFQTEKLLWHFSIAPFVWDVEALDLDGDGIKEIFVGSNSTSNGNTELDGTDDNHCYVYLLTAAGKIKWVKEVGGFFVQADLLSADMHGDGRPELLVWTSGPQEQWRLHGVPERGSILQLDASGNATRHYEQEFRLFDVKAGDLNGDAREEIVLTDRQGYIRILDENLKPIISRRITKNRFEQVEILIEAVTDITGDNQPEIIARSRQVEYVSGNNPGDVHGEANVRTSHDVEILILSAALEPILWHRIHRTVSEFTGFSVQLADISGDGNPEIISLNSDVSIYQFKPGWTILK
ncbi:MAG: protein kinase [Verrucomicrobiota bacterium]